MAEIVPENSYEQITRPYNDYMQRSQAPEIPASIDQGSGENIDMLKPVKTGQQLDNIVLGTWIKSSNYAPKKSGFLIDGLTGHAEFSSITLSEGGFNFGKSSFADTTAGYWLGPEGVYFGTNGDTTYIKYDYINATLAMKGALTITGGSGISNLSDAGTLATLDSIGASNCDTTIISGGKIITGLLTANNIQAGTLTVGSGAVGLTVNSGGDIVMNSNTGSSFSSIVFQSGYTTDGWEMCFVGGTGGGYQQGDLLFTPNRSNQAFVLGWSGDSVVFVTHGSVNADQVYVSTSGRLKIPVGSNMYN